MLALSTPMHGHRWVGVCTRVLIVIAAHIAVFILFSRLSPELRQTIEPVFISVITPEPRRADPPPALAATSPAPRVQREPVVKQAVPRLKPQPSPALEAVPATETAPMRPLAGGEVETAPAAPSAPAAVPTTPKAPMPVVAPRFDVAYLNNPRPEYPRIARRLGEHGRVVLHVFVSPAGFAEKIEIRNSSGYPRLDQAARDAVQNWKFVPARQGDAAVGAWVSVPINFVLEG